MKIIITGGAGFIGSNLVDALLTQGHHVVVIDDLSFGKGSNVNRAAKFYKADIKNRKIIENIFQKEKPRAVFHLAAQMNVRHSVLDPVFDAQVNVLGALNIVESAVKNKVKKFIFASTGGAIYGEAKQIPTPEDYPVSPISPYGVAKLAVEKYLHYYYQVFDLNYIALRYANVYGPRQNPHGEAGVVAIFINKMLHKENLTVNGSGRQTRDYVFVNDVVKANILALKNKKVGTYNVGTGKETNVNQIFKEMNYYFGNRFKVNHGPVQKGEQMRSCLDWRKIRCEFGWKPEIDLVSGIKRTIEWFKGNQE